MARISTSTNGGVVQIEDGNGNPITSTNGALDVNVDSGFDTLSAGSPGQIAIDSNSTVLLVANTARRYAHFVNNSAQVMYVQYGISAALGQGIRLMPGSMYTIDFNNLWLGSINAVCANTGFFLDVLEGE